MPYASQNVATFCVHKTANVCEAWLLTAPKCIPDMCTIYSSCNFYTATPFYVWVHIIQ